MRYSVMRIWPATRAAIHSRLPREGSLTPTQLRLGGLAAILFFLAHACYQHAHGRVENLLWACHLADLGIGIGLLFGSRCITATSLVMLGFGVPMWLVGIATGGEFYPTSVLTHVGGSLVGIYGLRSLGGLHGDWWKAYLAIVLLVVLSRWLTPVAMNVNFAHHTWPFARDWFSTPPGHLMSLFAVWATGLFLTEQGLQRMMNRDPAPPAVALDVP